VKIQFGLLSEGSISIDDFDYPNPNKIYSIDCEITDLTKDGKQEIYNLSIVYFDEVL